MAVRQRVPAMPVWSLSCDVSPFSTRFPSQFVPVTNPLQRFLPYRLCSGRETIADFSHAAAGGWWPRPTCLCFKCKFIVDG